MTKLRFALLPLAVALLLTACSGAKTSTDSQKPGSSSTAHSTAAQTSAAVSAADVCKYLKGQVPKLKGIGSKVGAMADLSVNLLSWYDGQGAVPDGVQIDQQTAAECPDVRKDVLALAGVDSFTDL